MSQEYILAITIVIGSLLKMFGVEIENGMIEGFIAGLIALVIAIRRKQKGDIDIIGRKI